MLESGSSILGSLFCLLVESRGRQSARCLVLIRPNWENDISTHRRTLKLGVTINWFKSLSPLHIKKRDPPHF